MTATARAPFSCLALLAALLLGLGLVAPAGCAEAAAADPTRLVREVTDELLADIAAYRNALAQAPDEAEKERLLAEYYDRLAARLERVVDFDWIALNVMGSYRKVATPEQRRRFREVFARSLVETYGRGLLTYSDQEIVVHPLPPEERERRRVVVRQEIRGVDQTYPLLYVMALDRTGKWRVINVIINGINLGQTFRNQFLQAAEREGGDLDRVIAGWRVEAESTTENG